MEWFKKEKIQEVVMEIRLATKDDAGVILTLIKELAEYEGMLGQVVATVEDINRTIFCENPKTEVLILEVESEVAGFALFFHNYSTFLCKHGIYVEDIYVREKFRGKGYGKGLLKYICQLATDRDCGRVEWWCLDWNKPSIDFYLNVGAEAMSDWTVYRLNKNEIAKLIKN